MAIRLIRMILVLTLLATTASAQAGLKRTIDSLFVIAASGELRYREMVEPAKQAIVAYGAEAVPLLVDKFTTQSARERVTIIQILDTIGEPAVPHLIKSLDRPEPIVVKRVAWALGDIGEKAKAATPALGRTCSHPSWWVREQSQRALGLIGDPEMTGAVLSGFEDSVGQVRKAAVVSAGELVADQAVERLVHALGDAFFGARLEAVEALTKLDTVLVIKSVADSLSSADRLVCELGYVVLGKIGNAAAMSVLEAHLISIEPWRRAAAVTALIDADPNDDCGLRSTFLKAETDPMVLLQVNSALTAVKQKRE